MLSFSLMLSKACGLSLAGLDMFNLSYSLYMSVTSLEDDTIDLA